MHNGKFIPTLEHLVNAMKELRSIVSNEKNTLDERRRAVGLSLCINHLMDILGLQNPEILGKLSNNLEFMKAEIQKEEEMAIAKSRPNSTFHEGGKQIH